MSQTSDLFENWVVFELLLALEELKILEYLRNNGSVSAREIAAVHGVDSDLLRKVCHLISMAHPSMLYVKEDMVVAGKTLNTPLAVNLLNFSVAYHRDIQNVTKILKGIIQPERQSSVHRDFLARSSDIYSEKFRRCIIDSLQNSGGTIITTFVDLGCGSGLLLKELSEHSNIKHLYGIDHNKEAFRGIESGTHPITCFAEDVIDVGSWSSYMKKNEENTREERYEHMAFSMVTILHEFTKTEELFLGFMRELKDTFPGATLFIAEQLFFSEKELMLLPRDTQTAVSFYQMIHHLTDQGLPKNHNTWMHLFSQSGLLPKVISIDSISVVYKLKL